jgi:hypothetical protein
MCTYQKAHFQRWHNIRHVPKDRLQVTSECSFVKNMKEVKVWWTAYGKRTLEGAEAILFAETLLNLVDEIRLSQFDNYYTGVEVFDSLTFGQKISVLAIIGNGLLRMNVPCVELTDVTEGAVGAVFEHLINLIAVEIDGPMRGSNWRVKVIAARRAAEGQDIPASTCDDLEEWIMEVGSLAESVLMDAGYDDDYLYLDPLPEDSKWLKRIAGISDN